MSIRTLQLSAFFLFAGVVHAAPVTEATTARLAEIGASENGRFPLGPAEEFQLRGGLSHFIAKAARGEALTIAYFGTSVSAQPGWRVMSFESLQKRFPNAKLTMLNASLGGSGSIIGAFRADRDLIAAKPDMVFVEFAGNDNPDTRSRPLDVVRAMEGIVRKIRRASPEADICFVYAFGRGDFATLLEGKAPRGATLHDLVAAHYNLPSIHLSIEVARLERDGKLVNSAPGTPDGLDAGGRIIFTNDGSHPTIPRGHSVWAGVVESGLDQLVTLARPVGMRGLPEPLLADNWERAQTLPIKTGAQLTGPWETLTADTGPACEVEGVPLYKTVPTIFRTTSPGASLTVRFRGTVIGLKTLTGPDSGIVSTQVDDRPPSKENQFTVYRTRPRYGGRPLPALPQGEHTVTWILSNERPDKENILKGARNKDPLSDFLKRPEKYAGIAFYAAELMVVGELLLP